MAKLLGKSIGLIINIIMIPIIVIFAIPIGILKARHNQKSRLLFTGQEQSLLAKSQQAINMDNNGAFSPDRDILEVARCIEDARCDYQIVKSREKFDTSFLNFVIPRINKCRVMDWDNVKSFFELSSEESPKLESLPAGFVIQQTSLEEGIRLEDADVDVLFIVKNNNVIYINDETEHLFVKDKDNDKKLNGRVVNFVFTEESGSSVVEVFTAFDDTDSYTMFTLKSGLLERLNYVAQALFKYFSENTSQNVFSPVERYSTQYNYTFKLYRKNEKYFMVNNTQTQAYLLDKFGIKRDDVDEIKEEFWGRAD